MRLKDARSVVNAKADCGIDTPEIALAWAGRTARVTVRWRDASEPVVVKGAKGRLQGSPVQDLTWWTGFSDTLAQREHAGCLAAGEAEALTRRIVDNLTLPSGTAYNLRYGNTALSGYLDLESQFALKSISPLRETNPRSFETVYYDLSARRDGGVRIAIRTVEHESEGKVRRVPRPELPAIKLGDSARFVRYFFRTWRVAGDRRIALLAATRRELVDPLTKRFEADPEAFCAAVPSSEATCVAVSKDAVVAPEVKVRANGRALSTPVGSTVADVLRAAKVRDMMAPLSTLRVQRPYNGTLRPVEFDHTQPEILRVVLAGGEDIRW